MKAFRGMLYALPPAIALWAAIGLIVSIAANARQTCGNDMQCRVAVEAGGPVSRK